MKKWSINIVLVICLFDIYNLSAKETINVIAIEYPPFTNSSAPDHGIAFKLLNSKSNTQAFKWQPYILPPARALKQLELNQWCASFYPVPKKIKSQKVVLTEEPIKVGLIRKTKNTEFSWQALNEMSERSIAVLRSRDSSEFIQKFIQAGMHIIYVENIKSAIGMVQLGRADFAISDHITFELLPDNERNKLDFSKTVIYSMPITIYLNNSCFASSVNILK